MKTKLIRITTVPISFEKLLKGQLAFMSREFEVIAISSPGEQLYEVERGEGVQIHGVEMTRTISPIKDLKALWRLCRIFRKEKPRIVHTHTPKAGTLGMMAAWLCRVPVRMHTVAGLPLLETHGPKRKLLDRVEKITYACATKVYPNSFGLTDILLKNGYAHTNKLKVIGMGSSNGIDTQHFSRKQLTGEVIRQIKETYGIGPTDFVFVYVGRIVKDKGITELVVAFKNLHEQYANAKLLILGNFEMDLDPLDKETINDIKQHTHIIHAGYQPEVRPFLAAANVLVFPSYREGLPNVPMQACAMEIPCIASDINGCNEIITHGHNGLLVPPKNIAELQKAMEHIMTDKQLYGKLASNARESIVHKYEQQSLWQKIKDEYREQLSLAGC